jgi:hypothetical protein
MARGIFAQFTKTAETTLRYRYVCENCGKTTDWFIAHLSHKLNRIKNIGGANAGSALLETPELVQKGQSTVNKQLNAAILAINTAITERTDEVVFPNEPFLTDAYNDIFQCGEACPNCGEQQTWYPAVSETVTIIKSIRDNVIIFAIIGLVVALIAKGTFSHFFLIPIAFVTFGVCRGWVLVNLAVRKKQKFVYNHPIHNNPEIEWNYVLHSEDKHNEISTSDSPPEVIEETTKNLESIISIKTTHETNAIYRQLLGKEHLNILSVKGVTADELVLEDFNGITLEERLKSRLSIHDFEDYFQQICDALDFLHSQQKPISYNNLTANNIVIGKDNLLKLFNFNKADNITPISADIEAIAKLMLTVDEKYISRYKSITKPCFNGTFKSFDDISTAIVKNVRNRLGIRYSFLATGLFVVFMGMRFGSKIFPVISELVIKIFHLMFG